MEKREGAKDCEELLNDRTIEILKTHKPRPLSKDLIKELTKLEQKWFARVGLKHKDTNRV
jgi:hypothetical protein